MHVAATVSEPDGAPYGASIQFHSPQRKGETMTNYTLRNDFHRTECTIRSRETHPISDYVELVLTDYQTRRLKRELCGMADCCCSGDVGTRGRQLSDDGKPIAVISFHIR